MFFCFFLGGGVATAVLFRQTEKKNFSDKPNKDFSDKPKIFPDDNILNLLPPPRRQL
jgi:hypothetical protein